MSCCNPSGYDSVFGTKFAERDARRFRRKGLPASARWLRDRLAAGGVEGRTVLEIGGGVGGLQIELLDAGATRSTNVELVDSYETPAESLLAERGLSDRVERRVGDFAQNDEGVPPADIVVMHRVLCCYPDADRLVTAACSHARDRIAITIPRRTWWTRAAMWAANAWMWLRRIAFRAYVHRPNDIERAARSHGFHVDQSARGVFWENTILLRD
jgi:methyltransferase family protein